MTEELPERFRELTPRPAPAALRERVLAAANVPLSRRSTPRWERVCEVAVAAGLVIGVGLSIWRWQADEVYHLAVQTRIPPVLAPVADAVDRAKDAKPGRAVASRLAVPSSDHAADSRDCYARYLHAWSMVVGEDKL